MPVKKGKYHDGVMHTTFTMLSASEVKNMVEKNYEALGKDKLKQSRNDHE